MTDQLLTPGQHLWFQHQRRQNGYRSVGTYRRTDRMNVTVIGDKATRHAQQVAILFPEVGTAFVLEDAFSVRRLIEKLQDCEAMLLGRGQSKVISLTDRKDWETG